jgi:hypothetical protein
VRINSAPFTRESVMRTERNRMALFAAMWFGFVAVANSGERCPRTLGADVVFSERWPQADTWLGSEALAVVLPANGTWPTTVEGHAMAIKLFWYSAGFQPGLERDFAGRIERLDEGPNDAVMSRPTNAGLEHDVWAILTGIDFRSAGCWRISGTYRGQSLAFVVETIPHSQWMNRQRTSD